MLLTYNGTHDAVNVLALGQKVKRGESIDVEDPVIAASLIEQGWLTESTPTTVAGIVGWVDGDPVRARTALEAEQARARPRKSLIDQLTELVDVEPTHPADADTTEGGV